MILNRNLPEPTDRLYDLINDNEFELTDIYVVEAGSDPDKLSSYVTWHANWGEAREIGLRYCRGMNFAIWNLWKEDLLFEYEYVFLLTNDVEFAYKDSISRMLSVFDRHQYLGILSPCSTKWGEYELLQANPEMYFWFIHNGAYMIRVELLNDIGNFEEEHLQLLFDGANFRGYGAEQELIAKAYFNGWCSAITSDVLAYENEDYLLTKADLIKTEPFKLNQKLYLKEGLAWMKKKYGFKSHWSMNNYVRFAYEGFFEEHPELKIYKV